MREQPRQEEKARLIDRLTVSDSQIEFSDKISAKRLLMPKTLMTQRTRVLVMRFTLLAVSALIPARTLRPAGLKLSGRL
jgi:hypothetical protein